MKPFRDTLPPLTPITMGTGGATDPANPDQHTVVRRAMESGIGFHVADYGGGVYTVLERAFKEAPSQVPHCIFKLDGLGPDLFRASVEDALKRTGVKRIDIGQICGNPVGVEMEPLAEAMVAAKDEGLVGNYIMDVVWTYSPKVIAALQDDLFDGYIFYYSPTERQVSEEANDLMITRHANALAMRTFGGRDGANYMTAADGSPIRAKLEAAYEASGCLSRVEFCVRFPLSLPHVRTTIGSTGNLGHLEAFLEAGRDAKPLPQPIIDQILALHRAQDDERAHHP
ncbi:MAG: hypothetical protein HQ523_08785 [Lentisphaerae bacterium]|nr:hypothetical protein [Lentisphaerota bacterium]